MASTGLGGPARERAAAARAAAQAAEGRRRLLRWSAAAVVVLVIAIGGIVYGTSSHGGTKAATPSAGSSASSATGSAWAAADGPQGPEGIPLEQGSELASASTAAAGQTVDGIRCESSEQVAYHIHAHLQVFVAGVPRPLPLGIGIVTPDVQQTTSGGFASATRCYYWLHTHAQDGVIHIESPSRTIYTLGQFFDEWRQPLSAGQVGPAKGTVTAYVDGKRYGGDVRTIPLTAHAAVQLDVGSPVVAPLTVDWSTSSL